MHPETVEVLEDWTLRDATQIHRVLDLLTEISEIAEGSKPDPLYMDQTRLAGVADILERARDELEALTD
jgi:hypothetical protein